MKNAWPRFGFLALLATFAAAPALATTYVVDSNGGPGSQFTDIASAIQFAQAGDVLLVEAGVYDGFTLSKGLTILGTSAISVGQLIQVSAIPAGERAVVARVSAPQFQINDNDGTVILDSLGSWKIDVDNSLDVRLHKVGVNALDNADATDALRVAGSRIEINDANLNAGSIDVCAPITAHGKTAVRGQLGSRIHIARSLCIAGYGGGYGPGVTAGDGGPGMLLEGGCEAIVAGGGAAAFIGTNGTINCWYSGCGHDGHGGAGITVSIGAMLRYSGANLHGGATQLTEACFTFAGSPISGSLALVVAPPRPDPTLWIESEPLAGGSLTFKVNGPSGSRVDLAIGQQTALVDDGAALIELLTSEDSIVDLGTLPMLAAHRAPLGSPPEPSSPFSTKTYTYPALPSAPGDFIVVQAKVTLPNGELRRTNSVPVVVR